MTTLRAVFLSLRPHQWTKNLFLFAALLFSKNLLDPDALIRSVGAFAVFCALSGAVYLLNDVTDIERDRLHPKKRLRPIASGRLSKGTAIAWSVALTAVGLSASAFIAPLFVAAAASYFALNLAYSFWLKNVVLLDVIVLSLGFVLRAAAGGFAISVRISEWLLVCTILLALFLALAKRRHELVTLADEASNHRAILTEYSPYLLDQMIVIVTASCLTAYAFYTLSPDTVARYQTHNLVTTVPFVLYGVFRYLYLVHQKEQGGSPSDVLLTDAPLLLTVVLWAAAVLFILYSAPGSPIPRVGTVIGS